MVAGNPKKMPNPLQVNLPYQPTVNSGQGTYRLITERGSAPSGQAYPLRETLAGLSALTNQINSIRSNWAANAPAMPQQPQPTGEGAFFAQPNFRFPSQTAMPAQQRPQTMGQMMSQQASTIQAGNAAVDAGRAWKLDGGNGQMPTFLPRNPMEQVRDQFNQTHMQGAEASVLSRTPQQRQLGYIDDKGQMTATNRLGMLRRMAATDPNNEQVRNALAAAEDQATKQMEARRARIPEFQAKAKERNDAKRARAMRQADAMRARMGIAPRKQGAAPTNPITGGALPGSQPRTIENQFSAETRLAERAGSLLFLGADTSQGVGDLNTRLRGQLDRDPKFAPSDDSLKAWQAHARDLAQLSTPSNDMFRMPGNDRDPNHLFDMSMWKKLATLPDNERERQRWLEEYRNPQSRQARTQRAEDQYWREAMPSFGM